MYSQNNYFLTRRPVGVRNFSIPQGHAGKRVVVYSENFNKKPVVVVGSVPVSAAPGIVPMVLGAGAGTAAAIPVANYLAPRTVDFLTQSSIGNHGPFMQTVSNVLNSALQGGKAPVDLSWSGKLASATNAAANELNGVGQKVAGQFQGVSEQTFADLSNNLENAKNQAISAGKGIGNWFGSIYDAVKNAPEGQGLAKFDEALKAPFQDPKWLAAAHDGTAATLSSVADSAKNAVQEVALPIKTAGTEALNAGKNAVAAGTHAMTHNPFDLAGSAISYGLPVVAGLAGAYAANKIAKAMQNNVAAKQAAAARAAASQV